MSTHPTAEEVATGNSGDVWCASCERRVDMLDATASVVSSERRDGSEAVRYRILGRCPACGQAIEHGCTSWLVGSMSHDPE